MPRREAERPERLTAIGGFVALALAVVAIIAATILDSKSIEIFKNSPHVGVTNSIIMGGPTSSSIQLDGGQSYVLEGTGLMMDTKVDIHVTDPSGQAVQVSPSSGISRIGNVVASLAAPQSGTYIFEITTQQMGATLYVMPAYIGAIDLFRAFSFGLAVVGFLGGVICLVVWNRLRQQRLEWG